MAARLATAGNQPGRETDRLARRTLPGNTVPLLPTTGFCAWSRITMLYLTSAGPCEGSISFECWILRIIKHNIVILDFPCLGIMRRVGM